ncbi:MAG: creatininase [Chloroflexi bacterium]|nr:creatininase [Chloroflexota bacterium]|tara:strand:- start:25666 stop:26415 length:750 start_codon:yes stop_codon:yes gene_type:complete
MKKIKTLMEMTNPEAEKILEETQMAIIPLGSVEQHGSHLPLGTDYYAAESFAKRIVSKTGGLLVDFAPFGVTPLHMGFKGTVTLRSETMISLMTDIVSSLCRHGAKKIVFINWHERNLPAIEIATENSQNEFEEIKILIVHAHFIAKEKYGKIVGLTHGGELEILPVLADRPELVHLELATDPSPIQKGQKSDKFRRDPSIYYIPKDVRSMYKTGWYGKINDTSDERIKEVMNGTSSEAARRIKEFFKI